MYEKIVESSRFCAMGYNGACDGCIFCGKSNDKDGECYQQLHKAAADAIESTNKAYQMISEAYEAEVTKQNWIPVTERLPKEMVLAHGRDGDIRSLEYSFTKKWWEDDDGYYCDTNYVTHWMPLPDPPKEET